MAQKRLSMRKIRDVLRLKYGLGRSHPGDRSHSADLPQHSRQLRAVGARGGECCGRCRTDLDDAALEAALYPPTPPSRVPRPGAGLGAGAPGAGARHKGVTLQLLWLEYREAHPDGYGYSRFCDRYREWRGRLDVVLRHVYRRARRRSWTTRARRSKSRTGSYPKLVQRLAKTWLLVLDDWGLVSLSGQGRHDLLEVLDDRYARRGTILASQLPVEHWHDAVGDPTFGDAILDRLLNNAHRITLKGGSMRRLYDSTKGDPNRAREHRPVIRDPRFVRPRVDDQVMFASKQAVPV